MRNLNISLFTVALLAGCVATGPVSTSVEHKGSITLVHHRQHVGNKSVDHLEAINSKGIVSQAVVEVYEIGRLPDGHGGMSEAHRYYHVAQSPAFDLRLPPKSNTAASGPRTVYTAPNYSPPPKDQRINDAVAEAQQAKQKLDEAKNNIEKRLAEDNNLRGELDQVQQQNQALQQQLDAAMATPQRSPKAPPETDAQKAAQNATTATDLQRWGQMVQGQP
jgi:hypothetical protein